MSTAAAIRAPRAVREARAVVVGGGPCGMVTAFALAEAGVSSVTILERGVRDAPSGGYSFAIGKRGDHILQTLPDVWERVVARGSQFREHSVVLFTQKGVVRPSMNRSTSKPVWLPRDALLIILRTTLLAALPGVNIRYGASFAGLSRGEDGVLSVHVAGEQSLDAELVLGCDGEHSLVRNALLENADASSRAGFELQSFNNPAVGLHFRALFTGPSPRLLLPAGTEGEEPGELDPHVGYRLVGSSKVPARKRLANVGIFPVGGVDGESRPATFALYGNHALWDTASADEFYALLEESIPHVNSRELFTREAAESFVNAKQRRFPKIQRARSLAARFPGGAAALLLGDAAHAFPPDLGQGVNAAFEDVWVFRQAIAASKEDASVADVLERYESMRTADIDAVLVLMRDAFPYQYGHVPWRLKVDGIRIGLRLKLHELFPWIFSKPVLLRVMSTTPYSVILAETKASNRRGYAILALIFGLLAVLRLLL